MSTWRGWEGGAPTEQGSSSLPHLPRTRPPGCSLHNKLEMEEGIRFQFCELRQQITKQEVGVVGPECISSRWPGTFSDSCGGHVGLNP